MSCREGMTKEKAGITKAGRGFTLSEMLMTVLIICLVVVLLGGGTVVIKNAYDKVTAKAEAQTILSTAVTKLTDEFRYAKVGSPVETTDDGYVKFYSSLSGCVMWFENGDLSGSDAEDTSTTGILKCRKTSDGTDKIQLLTDKTMAEGLTPVITYSYLEDKGVFHVIVKIQYKNNASFVSQDIYIKPVNN